MLKVLKNDWCHGWYTVRNTLIAALILSVAAGALLGFLGGRVEIGSNEFLITGFGNPEVPAAILSVVWFAVMAALLVLTITAILRNLSGRMFGPEGYITHTLPVHTWELLGGKVLGTWLFGVFMVFIALSSIFLLMASCALSCGLLGDFIRSFWEALNRLTEEHYRFMLNGAGHLALNVLSFLFWSLVLVIQLQFLCIASRQFGKYHIAGFVICLVVLLRLEAMINAALSMGFLVSLLCAAACFGGSWWLLKRRLSI